MATLIHDDSSVDYTPSSAVTAGDVIVQGTLVGVAHTAIAADTLGSLGVVGVYAFPKAILSTSAIAAGAKVYWDSSAEVVTETVGSNVYVGKVELAATATAATVAVRLDQ